MLPLASLENLTHPVFIVNVLSFWLQLISAHFWQRWAVELFRLLLSSDEQQLIFVDSFQIQIF